ncbi:alpha-amylase family protein [Nitrospirillum sp. BR 11164]|uniref:alpha-amylase family protein n=1 Tax=Nitrospirillum sp. BR 11164 TaxID=3104324 RepID=UPI002AFFA727|nr:alpha-amylase family protein [Nitrospirillum sp. BR 11164]MEA1651137.1 alpha-amylase family protein [Nitrospirillum sp. BR 11164]
MEANRREFALMAGAALAVVGTEGAGTAFAAPGPAAYPPDAWHQRMKRIVHVNFNERDPETFDVGTWVDYLASCQAQMTYLSGTNVVAFYPTALPDLPVSAWLKGRDVFGECVAAAKARGIRVMGRFSIDIAKSQLADTHPDWFCRTQDGALVRRSLVGSPDDPSASSEFAPTCQFSDYYTTFVPALFDEVLSRYPIDGIYSNGWPSPDAVVCYCPICRTIGDPHSRAYEDAFLKRAVELWSRYDALVKKHDARLIFTGNLGGGFRGGTLDLSALAATAPWFMADNQGRGGIGAPAWDASQQTRIGKAIVGNSGDRPVTNITAGYEIAGDIRWRNVTGNAVEVRSRIHQTLAAGGVVHYHWLGFQQGFIEDRRWQRVGREVLAWQAANDRHFHNRRSIASVALVVSQRGNRLYDPPAGTDTLDAVQGMYQLLTEARIPFDVVLDRDLTATTLSRYQTLVLPNIALMGDAQAAAVTAFAKAGGSVLATFETGLYDEAGRPRDDFALGALFGMRRAGKRESFGQAATPSQPRFPGSSAIQRIERRHPILAGFEETDWIQGSSCRVPITIEGPPLLTHVAQYPWYPTEGVYSRQPHTDQPTIAVREAGGARLVYLAADVEAGYWRSGAADLGDLVTNALRWLAPAPPITVRGPGLVEVFGWETEPGYALHLVNHTSPGFRASAARALSPLGPQAVRMTLPPDQGGPKPIRQATLLRAGQPLPLRQEGAVVEFTVPSLDEYEVVALEV